MPSVPTDPGVHPVPTPDPTVSTATVSQPPATPPCGAGSAPTDVLLGFSTQGTHGMEVSESLMVQCDGLVVLDAPQPWTTELVERPGRYTIQLAPDRLPPLRDLAVRLAAPVGVPSLPPQGAQTFLVAATTPPLSRPMRVGEGPADGEAAATHSSLTAEVIATLPAAVRCGIELVARDPSPLHVGVTSTVIVELHNPTQGPLEIELRSLRDDVTATIHGASVLTDDMSTVMDEDFHVLAFLEATNDSVFPVTFTVPPGPPRPFFSVHLQPTVAETAELAISVAARVRGCPGMTLDPRQIFVAPPIQVTTQP